jgi:hypothetical protein
MPLAVLIMVVLLAACALPHVPSRIVYEDSTNFVRLELDEEVLQTQPESRHSHPLILPVEQMSNILRGLAIREHRIWIQQTISGSAPIESVFSDHEISLMAPRLAQALATANADERVTFYLSHPQTSIKREITSGGLYVKGQRLHFILGNHRIGYGIPAYGMVYDRRYPMMPTAPKAFDLYFSPPEAVVKQSPGIWSRLVGRTKDEIVIDLQKVPAHGTATPLPGTSPSPAL